MLQLGRSRLWVLDWARPCCLCLWGCAEGPDWWTGDMYKHMMSVVAGLKMNFIGFHTYPYVPYHATTTARLCSTTVARS